MNLPKIAIFLTPAVLLASFVPLAAAQPDLFKTGKVRLVEESRTADAGLPDQAVFRNPQNLAVDAQGNVYVSDWAAHHVKVFGPDGKFKRIIGRQGQGPGDFNGPSIIEISGNRLQVKKDSAPHKYKAAAKKMGRRRKRNDRLSIGISSAAFPALFLRACADTMKWMRIIKAVPIPAP